MRTLLAVLLCLLGLLAPPVAAQNEKVHDLASSGAGFVKRITTVEEFESDIVRHRLQNHWCEVQACR